MVKIKSKVIALVFAQALFLNSVMGASMELSKKVIELKTENGVHVYIVELKGKDAERALIQVKHSDTEIDDLVLEYTKKSVDGGKRDVFETKIHGDNTWTVFEENDFRFSNDEKQYMLQLPGAFKNKRLYSEKIHLDGKLSAEIEVLHTKQQKDGILDKIAQKGPHQ